MMTDELIAFDEYGETGGGYPPLIIVHGLYGSAKNWRGLAKRFAQKRHVIVVDQRNHGRSFWNADHSYDAMALDIIEIVDKFGGRADLLGHSMGGKAVMLAALKYPKKVNKLVVADMAPVKYLHDQYQYLDAMKAVNMSRVSRRSDVNEQLENTLSDAGLRHFFSQSVEINDDGSRWVLNLDTLRKFMPAIMDFPNMNRKFLGPTLFIHGALSDYVLPDHQDVISTLFPNRILYSVDKAGHWLHAEQPKVFIEQVEIFLDA